MRKTGYGFLLVAVAISVACLGCGDGGASDTGGDGGGPGTGGTGGTAGTGGTGGTVNGAFEETYPVNRTFWHQGFKVEIGDAIYAGTEPDIFGDQVVTLTLEATFTNEGDDNWSLRSDLVLVTPGRTINPLFGGIPNVPGGVDVSGEISFRVDKDFDISTAYLLVGSGDEHQARVPLGANAGELIALEPSEPPVSGAINLTLIDMTFTGATLRYDDPVNHREVEDGKLALTLYFDATSRRSGNWSLFPQDFTLELPGGANLGVDGALLPSLQGSGAGIDTQGLYVRFLVDDPPTGSYTLRWSGQNAWYAMGDPNPATFDFELE